MRLYRTAKGTFVGTQADARRDGKGWTEVDVPTVKEGLLAFLNGNVPVANDNPSPAYVLGRSDAERGMTTNPYSSPDLRSKWEAGHAFAFANGAAPLSSFATRAAPRNGKRK